MNIKYLIKTFYWFSLIFLLYVIGKFSAIITDAYFLTEPVQIAPYFSNLKQPIDIQKELDLYSTSILGNMFETEIAPPGVIQNKTTISNLDAVKLLAILVWTNKSIAILNFENKTTSVINDGYFPNTDIKLKKVERSRVLLEQSGIEKWIELIRTNLASSSTPNKETKNNEEVDPNQATGGIRASSISGEKQEIFVSQQRLESELQNFSNFLNQARVFPNFENGQADGYVIRNIVANSIYQQLGLTNEDVIRTVNGQKIDSPERAFELFKLLRNEKNVSISIRRDGKPIDIKYVIN